MKSCDGRSRLGGGREERKEIAIAIAIARVRVCMCVYGRDNKRKRQKAREGEQTSHEIARHHECFECGEIIAF